MSPSTYPLRRAGDISALRLIRKLANQIDGIDLTDYQVGDVMWLPAPQAQLLIAEGWGRPVSDPPPPEDTGASIELGWGAGESDGSTRSASTMPRK